MRVLLVEDEKKLADAIGYLGKKEKIDFDIAYDGISGYLLAQKKVHDVIILDIMLPGKSGIEILNDIRAEKISTPILILTARDAIEDRVKGLDLGADDYLVKPFATQELFARIRSLARRINTSYASNTITIGNTQFNMDNYKLLVINKECDLSIKEAKILEMFMKKPGFIFTRDQILDKIWGYDSFINENNIEIYIHHLRKKLTKQSSVKIITIRGVGYSLKEK